MSSQLTLKIVPTEKVVLHEHVDPLHVATLTVQLNNQGILKNPILVTEARGKYVALDGATRISVLTQMGVPTTLVQIVSPDRIRLQNWHHAVVGTKANDLLEQIDQIEGLVRTPTDLDEVQRRIELQAIMFGFASPDGAVYSFSSDRDQETRVDQLNRVVDTYRGKSTFHRTMESDPMVVKRQIPEVTALFLFPRFSLENILHYATNHMRIPAGISRHMVDQRALRLNIPLDVLSGEETLAEKNEWLKNYIRACYQNKNVRTYEETTVVFND